MSHESLKKIESALTAFLAVADNDTAPGPVAAAFAYHLAALDARKLPPEAVPSWSAARRLLKAPTDGRVPAQAINAITAWPSSRIADLRDIVRAMATAVTGAANDRLADETNERVSRAYL